MHPLIPAVFLFALTICQADPVNSLTEDYNATDHSLFQLSQEREPVLAGKALYEGFCFACHDKDLSGATGFNLRDGEWIHGSKPTEIKATIANGFPLKGMVAFGQILSDEQLNQVTAYLISRQQGLRHLSYKLYNQFIFDPAVYEITDQSQFRRTPMPDLAAFEPTIENDLANNYIDVFITDEPVYGLEFNALLLAPESGTYSFKYDSRSMPSELYINDELLVAAGRRPREAATIELEKGVHRFRGTFFMLERDKPRLSVLWSGPGFKNEPLAMEDRKAAPVEYFVQSIERPTIYRGTMEGFPSGSLYIGFPQKQNVVIGVETGSLLGVWQGDFLDIGGAITKRSSIPIRPLGDWQFKEPADSGIQLYLDGKPAQLAYRGYATETPPAVFFDLIFKDERIPLEIRVQPTVSGGTLVQYILERAPAAGISIATPESITAKSDGGQISNGRMVFSESNSKKFTVELEY